MVVITAARPAIPVNRVFNNLFSSRGRIRRLEYGLSLVFYFVGYTILMNLMKGNSNNVLSLIIIPLLWFLLTQGAKRCHDINNSGWCQLIPFYFLWMIFKEGASCTNNYGDNPKQEVNFVSVPERVNNVTRASTSITAITQAAITDEYKTDNPDLVQQTILQASNVNYSLTQDILKKLRLLDKTNSMSYTLTGTTASITINHNNTTQLLLDDLYKIMHNIDVLDVKTGNICIIIK